MSITTAKASQAAAKAKAARLCGTSNSQTPMYPQGENASDKTGMRPVSKRQFKKGGKVVGKAVGSASAARADRPKRKAGGRIAESFVNKDVKAANKDRDGGKDHVGGLKRGGKVAPKKAAPAKKVMSKAAPASEPAKAVAKSPMPKMPRISEPAVIPAKAKAQAEAMKAKASAKPTDMSTETTVAGDETPEEEEIESSGMLKRGGRAKHKAGGRTKKAAGGPSRIDEAERQAMQQMVEKENGKISPEEYQKGNVAKGEYVLKRGGRAKRAAGGSSGIGRTNGCPGGGSSGKDVGGNYPMYSKADIGACPYPNDSSKTDSEYRSSGERKKGGRVKRKDGGRTKAKGKTNINIVIAAPQGGAGDQAAASPPAAPAPRMAPAPAPGAGGMPPMPPMPPMAGGGAPGGMPPMGPPPMRKAGGRVNESYLSLKGGAGSGLGRLNKIGVRS